MCKLVRANFDRLYKSKMFWGEIIVLTAFGLAIFSDNYSQAVKFDLSTSRILKETMFQHLMLIGILFSVFNSLFIGTEYSDGTIRNKLMVGQSRTNIYLSNFTICVAAGIFQIAVSIAVVFVTGYVWAGKSEMGVAYFFQVCVVLLFLIMSYLSIFHLFTMLITSKSHAAVVNILLAVAFMIFASYLYSQLSQPEMIPNYSYTMDGVLSVGDEIPNPNYISGTKRIIYQFLFDFLPGGQNMQVAAYNEQIEQLPYMALLCTYSAIITVLTNAIGIFMFRRKDIK